MKPMTFLILACTLVACEKIELPEATDEAKTKKSPSISKETSNNPHSTRLHAAISMTQMPQ